MATRVQRAVEVFLDYLTHFLGKRVMIFCRNGHDVYGIISSVDVEAHSIWLTNVIVRRGERAPSINQERTCVNAFGILGIILTPRFPIDSERYAHAESVWREILEYESPSQERSQQHADHLQHITETFMRGIQRIMEADPNFVPLPGGPRYFIHRR